MPLSMTNLRAETLEHLGIDDVDLDPSGGSANLDLLINRSWWDIISRFDFREKEKVTTFNTVAGTRTYSIQTIIGSDIYEAIRTVSITDPADSQHIPISDISVEWYEQNYNEQTSLQAQPTQRLYNNGDLILHPTPNGVYTVTVYYQYILNDLSAGNPAIPQDWHELILYGAVARGHIRARDYNSAKEMEDKQEREFLKRSTTQAKEDKELKFAAVQPYFNPYSVRH